MVSEAHCMSFPCTELLLFNYAKVKTVFHSMAPLSFAKAHRQSSPPPSPSPLSPFSGGEEQRDGLTIPESGQWI